MPKKSGGLEKKRSLEWTISDTPFKVKLPTMNNTSIICVTYITCKRERESESLQTHATEEEKNN